MRFFMYRHCSFAVPVLTAVLTLGCALDPRIAKNQCNDSTDCLNGYACVLGQCQREKPVEDSGVPDTVVKTDAPKTYGDLRIEPPVGDASVDRSIVADAGPDSSDGPSLDSVPTPDGPPPPPTFDWRESVMYFVLLDRFSDGDPTNNNPVNNAPKASNFQGGDLAGLLQKLKSGYFSSLGVNVLWLSSPVDAPSGVVSSRFDGQLYTGYHGYWPRDLQKVERRLGDMQLLREVVNEAHKRGIRVLLDYVMNHVHQSSAVYANNKAWFSDFYKAGGGNCLCGDGCSWELDATRCWFDPFLPDFDFKQKAPRDFSVDNAIWWIRQTGIDGFRLDAVKHIETQWLTELRSRVQTSIVKPNARFYMVGETFSGDKNAIKQYVNPSTMLDGQFDFPLRVALVKTILMRHGSFADLDRELTTSATFYGPGALMTNFLGNHDVPRSIHFAENTPLWSDPWNSGKDRAWDNQPGEITSAAAFERLSLGFTVLFAIPGIPLIYYGDEIGLSGAGDPDNRRMMQWNHYSNAQTKLRSHISKLGELRKRKTCLSRGSRRTLIANNDVFVYEMSDANCTVIVAINRTDNAQTVTLPGSSYTDLLSNSSITTASLSMAARSSVVLEP
jgi:glycosidase